MIANNKGKRKRRILVQMRLDDLMLFLVAGVVACMIGFVLTQLAGCQMGSSTHIALLLAGVASGATLLTSTSVVVKHLAKNIIGIYSQEFRAQEEIRKEKVS